MAWKSSFRQNYRTTFSPTVPTSAAGISHVVADLEAPGGEKWEHLKSGGKQWQATPKNLPRIQRTRVIPVAWLSSGLCRDRPKGWIQIIINNPLVLQAVTSNETRHFGIPKDKRKVNSYWCKPGLSITSSPKLESNFAFTETSCLINLRPSFLYKDSRWVHRHVTYILTAVQFWRYRK